MRRKAWRRHIIIAVAEDGGQLAKALARARNRRLGRARRGTSYAEAQAALALRLRVVGIAAAAAGVGVGVGVSVSVLDRRRCAERCHHPALASSRRRSLCTLLVRLLQLLVRAIRHLAARAALALGLRRKRALAHRALTAMHARAALDALALVGFASGPARTLGGKLAAVEALATRRVARHSAAQTSQRIRVQRHALCPRHTRCYDLAQCRIRPLVARPPSLLMLNHLVFQAFSKRARRILHQRRRYLGQ